MALTVVIPCHNVASHIEEVILTLPVAISYIVVVNDCSTDDTESIIVRLAKQDSRIIYIKHETNQGVGAALITGYKKSLELKSIITIKMDGDGQMDPSYIPALIKPILDDKADFVKGNRFRDFKALEAMPIIRRFGNVALSFMIKSASGYWNVFDPTNGYTAIRNETLAELDFNKIHKRYFFETSMLIELYYVNAVVQDVPMKAKYGTEVSGLSHTKALFEFPPKLFVAYFKRVILKYFVYDFNIASLYLLIGVPFFSFGIIYGLTLQHKYLSRNLDAPSGTFMIATICSILGFQLLLSALSYDISNYPKKQ
jgi:glycosyltransferase involved in cell wall biosynthesis